jgi:riboflavin biosynthesis pyrimidine reductase
VYTNFVATLDGVIAIPSLPGSNDFIAADSDADRFLMGLLRAFADAVLIGSGVLRASPRGTWRPDKIYPPAADAYAELRRALGAPAAPEVAVLTGSGSIDPAHPLLETGGLVLTTEAGAERLEGRLPGASTLVALGTEPEIPADRIVGALHERGHRRILSEAGPHTFGALLEGRVVDELFLTASPLLVGEDGPGSRLRLVEAADLAQDAVRGRLVSLRRHGSHLFHRYRLAKAG